MKNRTGMFCGIALFAIVVAILQWILVRNASFSKTETSANIQTNNPHVIADCNTNVAKNYRRKKTDEELYGEFKDMSWKKLMRAKPRMYKARGYPPTNNEVLRMWQWWDAMRRADPDHEWKTPIEFYGIVVDSDGRAVSGAEILIYWSAVGFVGQRKFSSGPDGKFCIDGISGKMVSIRVDKDGYLVGSKSSGTFHYGDAFFEETFHVPDKDKPVVFVLKKSNPDMRLLHKRMDCTLTNNGEITWINPFLHRKVTQSVALFGISCTSSGSFDYGKQADYVFTLHAAPGGGVKLNAGESYMVEAPESGYLEKITAFRNTTNADYSRSAALSFYFVTVDGSYGTLPDGILTNCRDISGSVILNTNKTRNLDVGVWFMPSVFKFSKPENF